MSLWFVLKVNNLPGIGTFEAQRQEHLDLTDPAVVDTVPTYRILINGESVGTVRHRYGDGAWELIRRALNELSHPTTPGVPA